MKTIAINGLGRIGRACLRIAMADPMVTVAAVNDLSPRDQIAYLLRHDSVYGGPDVPVRAHGDALYWGDTAIRCCQREDPADLPWGALNVDVVIEATGVFSARDQAARHLQAGAQRVLITAPAKNPDLTLCFGVNQDAYDPQRHKIVSNASCTTNCLSPIAKVLDRAFGIDWGFINTVHAVTGDQALVDQPHRKWTRGRSALNNIVPTTTGAAEAVGEVLPGLAGRLDGLATRVPVLDGSLLDLVVQTREPVEKDAVNQCFRDAAQGELHGILGVSEEELVSSDVIGSQYSALVDLASTMTVGRHGLKILAWYDNEWGYSCRVLDVVTKVLNNA